jgi:hypothetical protein
MEWNGMGCDGMEMITSFFMIINNSNSPALQLLISRIQSFLFLNTPPPPTFLFCCGFVWYPPLNGTSLQLAYIHCLRQL